MKNFKILLALIFASLFMVSCEINGISDDMNITTTTTSNLAKIFDISTDNSGMVKITPIGQSVASFDVKFGHGTGTNASATLSPGQSVTHQYPEGSYTVTITSYDIMGNATTTTYPLTVTFTAPTNLKIDGNTSGHLYTATLSSVNAAGGYLIYFGDVANEVGTKVTGTLDAKTGLIMGGPVTHTYANAGTYTVKVVAMSGGAAQTTTTTTITIMDPLGLPITYESKYVNYNLGGTFGGVDAAIVANPFPGGINTSVNVWKFIKNTGAETWAGTWTPLSPSAGVPINIDNGAKFKMMVYATEVGKSLHFQLEDGTNNKPAVDVPITVANQWQELTFDFTSQNIAAGHLFNQYVFQYNLAGSGAGEVIYIDNITQTK